MHHSFWIAFAFIGSFFFAYRNLKVGRGDLRGGLKLTLFLFAVRSFKSIILCRSRSDDLGRIFDHLRSRKLCGDLAIVVGFLYIALEPFVRRSWSEMLISGRGSCGRFP